MNTKDRKALTAAAKLEYFRTTLEAAQLAALVASGCAHGNPHAHECSVKIGRKYANIDVGGGFGRSGKYMVDLGTGEIFGIKGYGVIHRRHRFGTLDTIAAWRWGGYRATARGIGGHDDDHH